MAKQASNRKEKKYTKKDNNPKGAKRVKKLSGEDESAKKVKKTLKSSFS